jgi:dienelactone hydrolase
MSKAFTRESDGDEAGDDLPERPVSPHPKFVTAAGLAAIDAELSRLHGEAAELDPDQDRMVAARVARDLRYWTARRASAQLVDPPAAGGVVQFGSSVTVERADGRRQTFRIVGEDEAPRQGCRPWVRRCCGARRATSCGWPPPTSRSSRWNRPDPRRIPTDPSFEAGITREGGSDAPLETRSLRHGDGARGCRPGGRGRRPCRSGRRRDGRSPSCRVAGGPSDLMAGRGAETPISGDLRLPPAAAGRVPLMVISHGSGGILAGREDAWAERLRAQGVATFVVDSFGPRGIRSTGDDQSQLSTAASVADAFAALRVAATHPAIDPARIGVMGFSKGGQVALYTLLEPFRRGGGVGDLRFALHVALYASCSLPYRSERTTGAPVLMLLGGADDYTPADHCVRYADWFRQRGSAVRVEVFPGAHHGFDVPVPVRTLSRAQTARDCGLDIDLEPAPTGRRPTARSSPIPP